MAGGNGIGCVAWTWRPGIALRQQWSAALSNSVYSTFLKALAARSKSDGTSRFALRETVGPSARQEVLDSGLRFVSLSGWVARGDTCETSNGTRVHLPAASTDPDASARSYSHGPWPIGEPPAVGSVYMRPNGLVWATHPVLSAQECILVVNCDVQSMSPYTSELHSKKKRTLYE